MSLSSSIVPCQPRTGRPQLLLHIGMHKTGTTALQRSLEAARPHLLAEQGVLYADTSRPPWPELPKHTSVFHAAWTGDAAQQDHERDLLLAEFERSGAHTLLLSEEGLSEPHEELTSFFRPWRGQFQIRVVCLLRRQDLFAESLYNQFTREQARHEARSPLAFVRSQGLRQRLDYAALLDRWQEALDADVQARDFDDARLRTDGLMDLFGEAAGLAMGALPAGSANRSPDMRLCLALRRVHQMRLPHHLPSLLAAAAELEREGRFPPLRHLIGRDERLRLLETCAATNERLARHHGVHFSSALPEQEPAAATEDVEPSYLLELLARVSTLTRKG